MLDALRMTSQAETLEVYKRRGVEIEDVEEAESTVKLGDLGYVRTDARCVGASGDAQIRRLKRPMRDTLEAA